MFLKTASLRSDCSSSPGQLFAIVRTAVWLPSDHCSRSPEYADRKKEIDERNNGYGFRIKEVGQEMLMAIEIDSD